MLTIINYGSGNVRAISNIYDHLNIKYKIIDKVVDFPSETTKILLPGVGAFDETMKSLNNSGFRELLDEKVIIDKIPVLGICVGMQILSEGSEEGELEGLGWIKGYVKKFDISKLNFLPKVPHLGWNSIIAAHDSKLFDGIDFQTGFYFIHSYYFECINPSDILTTTEYGDTFTSTVNHNNIFGTQYHPEKSHKNGIQLLNNFYNI
jgi:glutamine amidotransferase